MVNIHSKQLRSCWDGQLTQGMLRPPKPFTSTKCMYFRQYLTQMPFLNELAVRLTDRPDVTQ